jgi:hypothetical protein
VNELEEGVRLDLDYTKLAAVAATGARVVPVVLQDADNGRRCGPGRLTRRGEQHPFAQ